MHHIYMKKGHLKQNDNNKRLFTINLWNFKHAKELLKHHQFASNFEYWNFTSNATYSNNIDNPNNYISLVI
jgi:hypothetical protein